jgi:hypothetical protein
VKPISLSFPQNFIVFIITHILEPRLKQQGELLDGRGNPHSVCVILLEVDEVSI